MTRWQAPEKPRKSLQALAFAQDVGENSSTIELGVIALGDDKATFGLRLNDVRVRSVPAKIKAGTQRLKKMPSAIK